MSIPEADKPPVKREVERVREWAHAPIDGYCSRKDRIVRTPVNKIPDECRGCPSDNWQSKGIVHRLKDSKQIVHREGEKRK